MSSVVTVVLDGGPGDGWTRPHHRDDLLPMPEHLGVNADGSAYRLDYLDTITGRWHYRWSPTRSGRRNPCQAGEDTCPGSRCPSGRSSRSHSP